MSYDPDVALAGTPFPCGQCLACRINKRRVWTARLMLESFFHSSASFVTLTYRDDELPYSVDAPVSSLCKRDLQLFFKRLRKKYNSLRYFAVGEYGEKTLRPHYHCIIFGVSPFDFDPCWMQYNGKSGHDRDSPISQIWSHGIVHVGECTRESIQYVAGYVLKKLARGSDRGQLEFSLMSRRPGIGAQAIQYLVDAMHDDKPPKQVRINGKLYPVGRYLGQKLADAVDYTGSVGDFLREMRARYLEYRKTDAFQRGGTDFLFVDWLVSHDDQRYRNLDARASRITVRDF